MPIERMRADLVVEHLVHVPMNVGDLGVGFKHLVHVAPVAHPEVPRRVVLVERIVAEDDDRLVLVPVGERLLQPVELVAADAGPRARRRCRRGSPCGPCALPGSSSWPTSSPAPG